MALNNKKRKIEAGNTSNLTTNIIEITEDKLLLILERYQKKMSKSRDWKGALGFLISTSSTLLCSQFKDFIWIDASTLKSFFIIGTVGALYYLFCTIKNCMIYKTGVDEIMKSIKNEKKEADK